MQRQDSGYESLDSRGSKSPGVIPRRRQSSASSNSHAYPPITRPVRTSTAGSRSLQSSRTSTQSLHLTRSHQIHNPIVSAPRFSFPTPDLAAPEAPPSPAPIPPPPQTTHYWTSDRTRRLEYAAIDAARHGLKGWARRNLVPGCMAPKNGGHLDFDDDSGSVRRYRLALDDGGEDADSGANGHKKGRRWWGRKV
jgi:hypothetical protein